MPAKKRTPPSDPTPRPDDTPATAQRSSRTAGASPSAARKRAAPQSGSKREPRAGRAAAASEKTADRPLHILMVTPEAHPFAKTGGLAEVSGALPSALVRLGHRATIVLPRYRGVDETGGTSSAFDLLLGSRRVRGHFIEHHLPDGVVAVLVDVPELFDRAGLYGEGGADYPDNALRFAVLSRAALEFARVRGERIDVIHAHDWQAGMVPVYQKMLLRDDPIVGGVPVVFTIHNLAFQGVFPAAAIEVLGLPWDVYHPEGLEYWGNISYLKGGVNFSERITTVSPTYAREILTPEFGFGFDGVLRRRAADLTGIINGIDVERWNPEADPFVRASYSAGDLAAKRNAKRELLQQVNLPADEAALDRPAIGLISRLTDQKGFDLIGATSTALMQLDATWVMLGSGDRHYEELWRTLAASHPDRVSATIGFDERLAHQIEAGADMFLMPSRFEPCGLNQLYSLRYGTVPIVRATGGLHDTVIDADQPAGNGISFSDYTPDALLSAVRRALSLYTDRARWRTLQQAGMAKDPSWDVSAREYVKVYRGH